MAKHERIDPVSSPPRAGDENRSGQDATFLTPEMGISQDSRRAARPDPETGEVPAGPGDAGLEDRPEVNKGDPGTRTMSNSRLGLGLAIAALLALIAFVFAALA